MHLTSLNTLFVNLLRDLYSAEYQIVEALPRMIQGASTPQLKQAFAAHLEQSRTHIRRLDKVFTFLNYSPWGERCEAMEGLLKETVKVMQMADKPGVRDVALAAALQRVEHYEIAGYGTVRTYAKELGYKAVESLLRETLEEEVATNKQLSKLAQGSFFASGLNKEAVR